MDSLFSIFSRLQCIYLLFQVETFQRERDSLRQELLVAQQQLQTVQSERERVKEKVTQLGT